MIYITGVNIIKQTPDRTGQVISYAADTLADKNDLPGINEIAGGSTCIIISTSQVFMLGAAGWSEL
jgi:hypothetical protein